MKQSKTTDSGLERYTQFVGTTTITHYTGHEHAPCVIGQQRLSYVDVAARTGLPAGRAARIVTAMAMAHGATSIKDLYRKSSPSSVAVPGFGQGSLLLLFRLFESEGLDHLVWARRADTWTDENGKDKFTTFLTYKKREAAADARTAGGSRARKQAIREQRKADSK